MLVEKKLRGEITAFLTIIFVLLAAFICSIVEIASLHEEKCIQRTNMDLAIYSVFGEYQKELLEQYHVFGIDAGYETGNYSEQAITGRLRYYGAEKMEHNITDLQFLSDNQGAAFYEQVLYYMESKYGVGLVREFTGLTGSWEEQMIQGEAYYEEKNSAIEDLKLAEEVDKAEQSIEQIKDSGSSFFLERVLPKEFAVSAQTIKLESMPSRRALNHGYGSFMQRDTSGPVQKLMFGEYLLKNFSSALQPAEESGLSYELEYIIGGKESDRENLEVVTGRLTLLRFAADYIYLMTDEGRKAEAETVAFGICLLLLMPELSEIVKNILLLVWAYQEGIQDVRNLLAGRKVPLAKTSDTWKVPLSGILRKGDYAAVGGNRSTEDGLSYGDYLRILLFLCGKEECTMRSLDMIETELKVKRKLSFFRIDYCVAKMKIKSKATLRQGLTYEFQTEFSYR
ncbi:MAG: hypothetical protein HFH53_08665 [Hespellia sp.]|nr:hypothetical protein [Hespellia sp.]